MPWQRCQVGAHGGSHSAAEWPSCGATRPSGTAKPADAVGDDGFTAASLPEGCLVRALEQRIVQGALHCLALVTFGAWDPQLSTGHSWSMVPTQVLGNHLMALLDLTQDAIRPAARLDVADLLTQALGVSMPKRSDFMAGTECWGYRTVCGYYWA